MDQSPIEAVPPLILFISDNGHGLGHLTRLLGVARRADNRFSVAFLTLSEAYPLLRREGFAVEYVPSYLKLGIRQREWQSLFARRLSSLMAHLRPRAVVVDHIRPPTVIGEIRAASSGVEWVWSRRGMWRKGHNTQALELSRYFDTILEPGDISAPVDVGATTYDRDRVVAIPPVILVPPDQQLSRDDARRSLGLPGTGRSVLIQLSDSDPEKLASLIARVRDVVWDVAGRDTSLFAPLHVLHRGRLHEVDGVIQRAVYPVARYIQAFDAVVSTAGYNSFHEVVASRVPVVFVARDANSLDDQRRRAEFALLCGRGYFAESPFDAEFREGVSQALRPAEREVASLVTDELGPFDGAAAMADLLAERVLARRWEEFASPDGESPSFHRGERPFDYPSGLQPNSGELWERVGYVLVGLGTEEVRHHVGRVREEQARSRGFKPIFLVEDVDPDEFDDAGFQFETVLSQAEWKDVGVSPYEYYLRARINAFSKSYQVSRLIDLSPDAVGRAKNAGATG